MHFKVPSWLRKNTFRVNKSAFSDVIKRKLERGVEYRVFKVLRGKNIVKPFYPMPSMYKVENNK